MARQFFEGNAQQGGVPPSFAMPHHVMPPEAERFMHAGPDLSNAWSEMQQAGRAGSAPTPGAMYRTHTPTSAPGGWSAEFDGAQMGRAPGLMHVQQQQQGMAAQANCEYLFCFARGACGIGLWRTERWGPLLEPCRSSY